MTAPFKWAHAVSTGPSHINSDTPCQDAVSVRQCAGRDGAQWIAAALADGAGSASHSTSGSQYAVDCFTDFLADALVELDISDAIALEDVMRRAAGLVHKSLQSVAAHREREPFSYAATFLGCVSNASMMALVQIGDGAVVLGDGDGFQLAFEPQHGEFINESFFITDADALENLQLSVIETPVDMVVMFSDGLEDLLICNKPLGVHPPLFNYIAEALAGAEDPGAFDALSARLAEIIAGPAVTSRSDDDTSIIALSLGAAK